MSSAQSSSLNLHITTENKNGCLGEAFPLGAGGLGIQGAQALAMPMDAVPSLEGRLVDLGRIPPRVWETEACHLANDGQSELGD